MLVTGSDDETVKLWDLSTEKEPALLPPRLPIGTPDPDWHEDQAELAVKQKHWFAAGFHFNRLAALRPGNPELRQREAKAWTNAGEKERAALALATLPR
jgi:Flp pilus assembly protein TadD